MHGDVRRGPLPGLIGRAAAVVYRRVIDRINRKYDAGRGVVTLDRPVISVGNLSVGGTGKTPTVSRIVTTLIEHGHRPAIAMRGYKATAHGSDEAVEYVRAFGGRIWEPPVVVGADRIGGLIELFGNEKGETVDAIVLDDGFQHRRIARQLDVVLIDCTRDPFLDRLLPAGWLREPVESLNRADVVLLTHGSSLSPSELNKAIERVKRSSPGAGIGVCEHRWFGLRIHTSGSVRETDTGELRGRRVGAVCALGNPGPFLAQAALSAGSPLVYSRVLPDHDPYSTATLESVLADLAECRAEVVVTTEKDWSKLQRVRPQAWPCEVAVVSLRIGFVKGSPMSEAHFDSIVVETVERGVATDGE